MAEGDEWDEEAGEDEEWNEESEDEEWEEWDGEDEEDEEEEEEHPIFGDIERNDLEAVQAHVLADPAVLDERRELGKESPLMHAICHKKPAIALWLIEHRGQHNVDTGDHGGWTALHWACVIEELAVVQALVAAGASPAVKTNSGWTPLMLGVLHTDPDIVAFLLQQPAIQASINVINRENYTPSTALSLASRQGHQSVVQLLLDAGADPTIPAGQHSPLNNAISNNHHDIAALLRRTIDEPERAKALHKIRALLDAVPPPCLQGRVERRELLSRVELNQGQGNERLRATVAFAVGLEGGEKWGMCDELYKELLTYMLPESADKGPAGAVGEEGGLELDEEEDEEVLYLFELFNLGDEDEEGGVMQA